MATQESRRTTDHYEKRRSIAAMMQKTIVFTTFAGIVLLLAMACGGGGASGSPPGSQAADSEPTEPQGVETPGLPDSAAEDDLAASMLFTLEDFPAGWVHKPGEPPENSEAPEPLQPCFIDQFAGQTGKAVGGEFSDVNTTLLSINPSVYVFNSAQNAQGAAGKIMSNVRCFADVIGDGLQVDGCCAFGRTYTEPLAADVLGATHALRLFNTQIYKDEQPPHSDVLVFDVVIIVEGRVLYEVDGFQRHSPIDQTLLKRYVDNARAKISQEP